MRGNKNGLWSYTVSLSSNEVEFFPRNPQSETYLDAIRNTVWQRSANYKKSIFYGNTYFFSPLRPYAPDHEIFPCEGLQHGHLADVRRFTNWQMKNSKTVSLIQKEIFFRPNL